MDNIEREQILDRVQQLADWFRAHPEIALPSEFTGSFTIYAMNGQDSAIAVAKAFGSCIKNFDDNMLRIKKEFTNGAKVSAVFYRNDICEKVVVGTREVPEQIIPEQVIAARTEDVVEWRCAPILADTESASSATIVEGV